MSENKSLEKQVPSTGNGTKSRQLFKDTLTRALLADDSKQLRALCDKALKFANDPNIEIGDFITILKFISERTDGRPAQSVEVIDGTERPSSGLFKIVRIEGN